MAQTTKPPNELDEAALAPTPPFWREFYDFARYHKKLWLAPVFLVLLLLGLLTILSGSAVAPFIYTLF
jgi:hypothetical protein